MAEEADKISQQLDGEELSISEYQRQRDRDFEEQSDYYRRRHKCGWLTECCRINKNVIQVFYELKGLELYQYDIFALRYMPLYKDYQRRCLLYASVFHVARTIVTVGSIIVPALLSLQNNSNGSLQWLTWSISLAVTIFNGIIALFKIDKKYYFLHTTKSLLETEAWQYISLSGKYSKRHDNSTRPNTHEHQFVYFCLAIERLKMKQVEEEYYKAQDTATGPVPSAQTTTSVPVRNTIIPASVASPSNQSVASTEEQNDMRDLMHSIYGQLKFRAESKSDNTKV
jgi:hypothetical protein